MRKLLILSLTVALGLSAEITIAQKSADWCGQVPMEQQYLDAHPEEANAIQEAERQLDEDYQQALTQRGSRAVKVIPVVFHIIHLNGSENISEAQVLDQMRILNEDYNLGNADLSDVVSGFTNVIGNVGIEFRLARKDPSGNPTNGIDRIVSSKTNQGGDGAKLNPWSRSKYLNIWVIKNWNSNIPNGVLAYAYKPGSVQGSPNIDGIIVKSQYVGSIGTGRPVYARTLTHEIGHYLNLSHTWGNSNNPGVSTNCNGDDGVSDTPNCIGTFSCNLSMNSCGSLDNIQNHMDYADCTVMFTHGQGMKMRVSLDSPISSRNNLSKSANLTATGVNELYEANFTADRMTICQHESVDFTDKSAYDPTAWNWSFTAGQNGSSTSQNPQETYTSIGLHDVTLKATSGSMNVTTTKVGYVMVNPLFGKFAPFSDDFSSVTQLNHENWYSENDQDDDYYFEANANNGYNASRCVKLKNFGNEGATQDALVSTTYDLRMFTSVNISFKVAYARKSNNDLGKMVLYVSNDCGVTWSPKWSKISPLLSNVGIKPTSYTPSSNADWTSFTVSGISGSSLSQTSQFKFVFENKEGNNLYIDDVNVTGSYSDQAQLKYPFNGMAAMPNTQSIYWKATGAGVDSYEYELDTDPAFNTGNLQTGINTYISVVDGLDTEFTPTGLVNGQKYYWRVRLIKSSQAKGWSDTWNFTVASNGVSTQDIMANKYQFKVFPNPMKQNGVVSFTMPKGENIALSITDLLGKTNLVIAEGYYGQGTHLFNISELDLPAGVYVVNMNTSIGTIHQKFIVQ